MQGLFDAVVVLLLGMGKVAGLTYNEINIVVFYMIALLKVRRRCIRMKRRGNDILF